MKLRSSVRNTTTLPFDDSGGYPDGQALSPLERHIAQLNRQSFEGSLYAKVDDILVYALFGAKRRTGSYRALNLDRVFFGDQPLVSSEVARDICGIYHRHADNSLDSAEIAKAAADEIIDKYGQIFSERDCHRIIVHLIGRYHPMKADPTTQIGLDKVQFHLNDNTRVTAGLRAKRYIGAGTVILTACSSMSSNIITRTSLSTIEAVPGQLGPSGSRLILGPFRFANHACDPNSQIMPIVGTHAFTICAIRDIQTGEPVTVKYSADNSYFSDGQCGCDSCRPDEPPIAPRRVKVKTTYLKDPNKKVTRRGGRRARQRQANKLESNLELDGR